MHNLSLLLMELAAQRIRQELQDAEAARRARLAEAALRAVSARARPARGIPFAVWGAVRETASVLAAVVRFLSFHRERAVRHRTVP